MSSKYAKTLIISQKVKVKDYNQDIEGYLTYMTCNDSKCLPPQDVDFSFQLEKPQEEVKPIEEPKEKINAEQTIIEHPTEELEQEQDSLINTEEIQTASHDTISLDTPQIEATPDTNPGSIDEQLYGINQISQAKSNQIDSNQESTQDKKSLWGIFLLGMLSGFLALLTPCVFPLIPLTVSFFTKGYSNPKKGFRDAILYGLFIFMVYILLSLPFHILDSINPDILNEISTNVWLNLGFFIIFLAFAFSFFGYYELTLPSKLTNRVSQAEGIGGIIGIFFMALTLAIVSFSCTGPILGSLLAGSLSTDGGAWQLSTGMAGFGLALALPFMLFAMFPGWMNKMPKSGSWLNNVKVVLGFLELALALKFLSNADLVMHWGLLRYELFIGLWILIGIGMSLYLLGIIQFPHDSKKQKLSFLKLGLGIITILFTAYLITGLAYKKETNSFRALSLLSGLAPPTGYSWIYPNDCPNNINCFKDLESGLAYAQKQNKPVLLDFTGYACVNCRKMEEHVWSDNQVFSLINEDYVLISLYVDDKKELPQSEKLEVKKIQGGKRKLRNYGHKWAHFQTKFFQTNSQPYYVLLSPDGEQVLNQPVGYTPDVNAYTQFLKSGLMSFKQL